MLHAQPLDRRRLDLHAQQAHGGGELILVALARRQKMQCTLVPLEFAIGMSLAVVSGQNQGEIRVRVAMPRQRYSFRIQCFA